MMRNWHFSPASFLAASKLHQGYEAGGGSGAPDGGGGDGSDAGAGDEASAGSDQADGDGADASDGDGTRQAADGDPDDDDSDDLDPAERQELERRATEDIAVRRLLARNRRLSKDSKRFKPIARFARSLGIENEQQLRDLHLRAHTPPAREGTDSTNRDRSAARDAGDQPLAEDLPFDFRHVEERLTKAGLDLNDPYNRAIVGEFRAIAEFTHELGLGQRKLVNILRALNGEVGGVKQSAKQRQQAEQSAAWQREVDGAVKQIKDPDVAAEFRRAVAGRVQQAFRAGQRLTPQQAVAETLKVWRKAGVIKGPDAARIAAGAARIAEKNRTLPRSAAVGGNGAPGAPTKDRSKETIRDIHRQRFGPGFVGGLRRG